ncbi:hypothetical protein BH11GEM2_BH11GEM2_14020 [soil metagenome]
MRARLFTAAMALALFPPTAVSVRAQTSLSAGSLTVAVSARGVITELRNTATGKDYLYARDAAPVMTLVSGGTRYQPTSLAAAAKTRAGRLLTVQYANAGVQIVILVREEPRYVVLQIVSSSPAGKVDAVIWGPSPTVIGKTVGEVIGVVRDGEISLGMQVLNMKTLGGDMSNDEASTWERGIAARPYPWGSTLQAYGRHVPRVALEQAIAEVSRTTRVWVDETYVEYAGADESLECFASTHENVVVCKSMSKVYGLSGLRVGYLCASPTTITALRPYSPPWAVGLIGQVAAVYALNDQAYYREQWAVTRGLRDALAAGLRRCGMDVVPGIANFVLCHLPADGPDAATVVRCAREWNLFVRDVGPMGSAFGSHAIRVAVKHAETNGRILNILARVVDGN